MLGVEMSKHNLVASLPKFNRIFVFNAEETVVDNAVCHFVDILIPSRDIRGQSRKLS